ncbi:general transcription factor II-I repeat domain-containing protein 2A-like [Acipenser ruthenus]|uniref:general transcription factor II-I repeat domain-containing protein 2A-like n=1 Tax=Acipenser ruthenus TaxID=7906 RepID=UPI002741655F|nr:general transcription factor II-I repeat domain-containing protein 2A-like [Acipenser ruthenus]
MVDVAGMLCPEYKNTFENISLSRRTVARRIEVIDEDLASQLNRKAQCFTLFSLALDDSTDIKDTAQLLIFVRGINNKFEITEEFLSMESMKGTTKGLDLYERVSGCLERLKLPWSKLANVTTDGSPNLTGKKVGLLKRIEDKVKDVDSEKEIIFLHCIIHQEALCKNVLDIDHVVRTAVKIVNYIRARGLNHRQFISLLEDTDAEHQDLLYHTNVRWLSLGKVLQRVWELRDEINIFLEMQGKENDFPELRNSNWVCDLAFGVDIMAHLNELNVKLQGKDVFVHELYSNVKAFKVKLILFSKQMKSKLFAHFPTLKCLEVSSERADRYSNILSDLHGEFSRRFSDFEKIEKTLELVSCPLSFDYEKAPEELQLELIELQCDSTVKEKYHSQTLDKFYASLNETKFPNIRNVAQKILVLFASTYVCEQTFSLLNFNKSRYRSQLTDQHLSSVLRISTTRTAPDFDAIVKKGDQLHCSH